MKIERPSKEKRPCTPTGKFQNMSTITIFYIGSIFALLVIVSASLLYYHFNDNNFNILSIWVSNLGITPSMSSYSFNYGLMITAVFYSFMIIFFLYRYYPQAEKTERIFLIIISTCGVIAVVGIFLLTNNDMVNSFQIHNIGAYMYFGLTPAYTTMITIFLYREPGSEKFKLQKYFTIFLLIVHLSIIPVSLILAEVNNIPFERILGSMDYSLAPARVLEWTSVIGFFLWIFLTGVLLKVIEREKKKLEKESPCEKDKNKENKD